MKKFLSFLLFSLFSIYLFSESSKQVTYVNRSIFNTVAERKEKSSYRNISSITINVDNSVEMIEYGEQIIGFINYLYTNDNLKTFYITDENNEILFYGYQCKDDFNIFEGSILSLNTEITLPDIKSKQIFINSEESFCINEDIELYSFFNEIWYNCGAIQFIDENNLSFYVASNSFMFPDYLGFYSNDKSKLYIGSGIQLIEKNKGYETFKFHNPKLTKKSINFNSITFKTTFTDFLLKYPFSRFEKNGDNKDYILDNFNGFDTVTFNFMGNQLSYFYGSLEESVVENFDSKIPSFVQNYIKQLTDEYGIPEIFEDSYDHVYATEITRKYFWSGEIGIEITFKYNYMSKYGIVSPSCEILYTTDVLDLY